MARRVIDRLTDTTAFKVVLFLSGIIVLPILALGLLLSAAVLPPWLLDSSVRSASFPLLLLSAGGATGIIGWLRALIGIREPEHHNIDLTMVCLTTGVVTALAVGGFAVLETFAAMREAGIWGISSWSALWGLFAAAHAAWILFGIAWMQRLARRYQENTGRSFDVIPPIFLLLALSLLVIAAIVGTLLV